MISVIIPTYNREKILIETLQHVSALEPGPAEILVVDQTLQHENETETALRKMSESGVIKHIRLSKPSVTHAMNMGILKSSHEIVLFLDDDIIPDKNLIRVHLLAQMNTDANIIAGQVLQPGQEPSGYYSKNSFTRFTSVQGCYIDEFMGGNFSVKRALALKLGGFNENFVHVAYNFELDFADRAILSGEKIFFEPTASIRHLRFEKGGTRSYGNFLATFKPSHAVGAYYYMLSSKRIEFRLFKILKRPFKAIYTKFHMKHPWWIVPMLIAELTALLWAFKLAMDGPRYITERYQESDD